MWSIKRQNADNFHRWLKGGSVILFTDTRYRLNSECQNLNVYLVLAVELYQKGDKWGTWIYDHYEAAIFLFQFK